MTVLVEVIRLQKLKFPSYRLYSTVYMIFVALIITRLIGGKVTHQGFVLGIVAIVTGLLLIYRSLQAKRMVMNINACLFCAVEIAAIIVVAVNNDPAELWFASFYAIFSILMICEMIYKRWMQRIGG